MILFVVYQKIDFINSWKPRKIQRLKLWSIHLILHPNKMLWTIDPSSSMHILLVLWLIVSLDMYLHLASFLKTYYLSKKLRHFQLVCFIVWLILLSEDSFNLNPPKVRPHGSIYMWLFHRLTNNMQVRL